MKNLNLTHNYTFTWTQIDFGITPLSMITLIQYTTFNLWKYTYYMHAILCSLFTNLTWSHLSFTQHLYHNLYVQVSLLFLCLSLSLYCIHFLNRWSVSKSSLLSLTCSAELRGTARRPVSTPISSPERSKLVLLVKVKIYTYVYGQGVCNFGGPSSGAPLYGKNTFRVRSLLSDYFTTDLEDRGLKPFWFGVQHALLTPSYEDSLPNLSAEAVCIGFCHSCLELAFGPFMA